MSKEQIEYITLALLAEAALKAPVYHRARRDLVARMNDIVDSGAIPGTWVDPGLFGRVMTTTASLDMGKDWDKVLGWK
jgi:hypothetical protein